MVDEAFIQKKFSEPLRLQDFAIRYRRLLRKQGEAAEDENLETLQILEKYSMTGALYTALTEEKDIKERYIDGFLSRNRESLVRKIRTDQDDIAEYMKMAYLCMMGLSPEDCTALAKDLFSGDDTEHENREKVTQHYASVFARALTGNAGDGLPKKLGWAKHYCKISKAIYAARGYDADWFYYVEFYLRKNAFGDTIDDATAKDYFKLLCDVGCYESARFFLDNFDRRRSFLGLEPGELVNWVYSLPDVGMLAFGRWYAKEKLDENYSYEQWLSDVQKKNTDENTLKWLKLTVYYNSLRTAVEINDMERFEELLAAADTYELFDMQKTGYVKQLVLDFAYIVNTLVLNRNAKLAEYLKRLEPVNINGFHRKADLSKWNEQRFDDEYDYRKIEDGLCSRYTPKDAVYIYMNSHLKHNIRIEKFVEQCAAKAGENGTDLYDLFREYPLTGRITEGSRMNAVRDKLYISPVGLATDVDYKRFVDTYRAYGSSSYKTKEFNKKLIRSDQVWYSHNKETGELMHNGDYCRFRIKAYIETGGILATDIVFLHDNIRNGRIYERNEKYPGRVKAWLRKIRESGAYCEWSERYSIYGVRHLPEERARDRSDIALGILEAIDALQDNIPDLRKFLSAITTPPLEEINEFRFIPTQKKMEFYFPREEFASIRESIIKKLEQLMHNEEIPAEQRREIYLNTCARKCYDFERVWQCIGDQFDMEKAEEPLAFYLRFESREGDQYDFSATGDEKVLFSKKKFVYRGEEKHLTEGQAYLVELRGYDAKGGSFVLNRVALANDQISQWSRYLRKMRDIKKETTTAEIEEIGRELSEYHMKIAKSRIEKFAYELDRIFASQSFRIDYGYSTVRAVWNANPFVEQSENFAEYAGKFGNQYSGTYRRFLEDYREESRSQNQFCDLFFASYLRVFVTAEQFLRDLAVSGEQREEILDYCRRKGYHCISPGNSLY